jgi:hypothetical protein
MPRPHRLFSACVLAAAALAVGQALAAQRHFVASTGNDANPCALLQPCRTFAAAAALVDPNGEIIVLDTAGYGAVTVTKPLSIISPSGVYAGISVFAGQSGITINAPGGSVKLAGLWINGQGGDAGIDVQNAARVTVEGVSVTNMGAFGFVSTAAGAVIAIRSSVFRDNGFSGIATSGAGDITIDGVHSSRNGGLGISITSGKAAISNSVTNDNASSGVGVSAPTLTQTELAIRDHTSSGNAASGIYATQAGLGQTFVTVSRSAITSNAHGVYGVLGGQGQVRMSVSDSQVMRNAVSGVTGDGVSTTIFLHGNKVTDNPIGVQGLNTAQILSVGNNTIAGNGTDTGTGYGTFAPK